MRKFYTTLILSLITLFAVPAQNQTKKDFLRKREHLEKRFGNNQKTGKERISPEKNEKESPKKSFSLRNNAQNPFQPDSLYTYSEEGKLTEKIIFTYDNSKREYTQASYKWSDELEKMDLDHTVKEVYDERGNIILIEELTFHKSDTIAYAYGAKEISEYDENDERIYNAYYLWDQTKNEWYLGYEDTRDIQPDNYIRERIYYNNETGEVAGKNKLTIYFENENIKSVQENEWSFEENKWVDYELRPDTAEGQWIKEYLPYIEHINSYNSDGKLESYYVRATSTDPENPFIGYGEKTGYKYEGDNMIEQIVCKWDEIDSVWVNSTLELYNYDPNNNLISYKSLFWDFIKNDWTRGTNMESSFDDRNNKISLLYSYTYNYQGDSTIWENQSKTASKYDSLNRETLFEMYVWIPNDTITGEGYWEGYYKEITEYLNYTYNGEEDYYHKYSEYQQWDNEHKRWTLVSKEITETDAEGKPSIIKDYKWEDGQWALNEYTVFYPYTQQADVAVDETKPVNDDNEPDNFEGKFTLVLNVPSDAIPSGVFDIILPEGFTLDQQKTALSDELTGKADMTLTDKGGNKWQVKITEKTLRAANEFVYRNILDVAYKVDESVASEVNEIVMKDMSLSLSTGGVINKEELKVNIVPKSVLNINSGQVSPKSVSLVNGQLTVDTPDAETVSVYLPAGIKVYSATKGEGYFNAGTGYREKGLVIVTGSSGWTYKVMAK